MNELPVPFNVQTFKEFNLNEGIMEGLESMGYEVPTPIQSQVIPHILHGNDIIGCAQTGTGKTAAYLLPILHKIVINPVKGINALIIAPTRELALQAGIFFKYKFSCGLWRNLRSRVGGSEKSSSTGCRYCGRNPREANFFS